MPQLIKMKKDFFKQELESLNRTIDFIQEEQAFIKRKMTIYIDAMVESKIIFWAEEIQQQILNREVALQLIKKDFLVYKASKTLDEQKLKKDKQQLGYLEQEFIQWKHAIDLQLDAFNNK
jgi:hypothetical protein